MNKPALVTALSLLVGGCSNPDLLDNWFPSGSPPEGGMIQFGGDCHASGKYCIVSDGIWSWNRKDEAMKQVATIIKSASDMPQVGDKNYCSFDHTETAGRVLPTVVADSLDILELNKKVDSALTVRIPQPLLGKNVKFAITLYPVWGSLIVNGITVTRGASDTDVREVNKNLTEIDLPIASSSINGSETVVALGLDFEIPRLSPLCTRVTNLKMTYSF